VGVEQAEMELSLPLSRRAPRRGAGSRGRTGTSRARALHALELLSHSLLHNRLRLRITLCALVASPLIGGGWLWLRDSSLVSVRHVHITGVHGTDALEIRQALDNAAVRMTTLDFKAGVLRSAVSSFAIVGALHVRTSFPHSVSISVSERPPVVALLSAGQRTAVAADGTVLGPAFLSSSLPTINGAVEPPAGARLHEQAALAFVAVLAAAPSALAPFVVRVFDGPEGLTVAMRNGLLVYFGDSTRPHAKWLSLARVLTSPSAAGAWYVDVRLPERPAAGLSSSSSASATPIEAGASDPTAAALAESLAKAAGGSAGAAPGASSTSGTTSGATEGEASAGGSSSESATGESERSSGSSSGTSTAAEGESSGGSSETTEASGGPSPGG
jgi:cell division protein FtsQ